MSITFSHPKKLFLLDQDGTLYKGRNLFPFTLSFLNKIKASGASYLFITNNSSKTTAEYVAKMKHFGIAATLDDFYTSTSATIDYLHKHHAQEAVYLVATRAVVNEFKEAGIKVALDPLQAKVAILTYDTSLDYEKLTILCTLLKNDKVVYLATNPDLVCPTEDGYLPDCGSFASMIFNATGRNPLYLGKPRALFVETILERFGLKPQEVVIVGDRLYTDIALGVNSGVDTVLVLSGEATKDDIKTSPFTPTHVVTDVSKII